MNLDPLERFRGWYKEESDLSTSSIPGACCLSTNGTDGFPNARFLALKEVDEEGFVFGGPASSRKGIEIATSPEVALTFWWPATERQVRIQGVATRLDDAAADRIFQSRSRAAQVVAQMSRQGRPLDDHASFRKRYRRRLLDAPERGLSRPVDWYAWRLRPVRMEFLAFSPDRLHLRELYSRSDDRWLVTLLQP